MAHYAKVLDGKVINVIVADEDFINNKVDTTPGFYVQTSYNTRGGVHYQPGTNTPSEDQSKALRGNYAGIDYIYDSENDVFYNVQPFPSWTLNNTTWFWEAPVAKPNDGKQYMWNEDNQTWDLNE